MRGEVWRAPAWSVETRRVPGRPMRDDARPPGATAAACAAKAPSDPGEAKGAAGHADPADRTDSSDEDARAAQAQAAERAAQAELEALRGQARKDGYEAGLAQGLAEAHTRLQADLDRLQALAGRIDEQLDTALSETEGLVLDLVLEACRKVFGDAALGGDAVRHVVARAMEAVRDERVVEVRVHADDLAWLGRHGAATPDGAPFVADGEVMRGGCIVRFAGGTLDARIDRQFKLLARTLSEGMVGHG